MEYLAIAFVLCLLWIAYNLDRGVRALNATANSLMFIASIEAKRETIRRLEKSSEKID